MLAQALLGGATVLTELPGWIVATHLALAEALLACLILVAVVAYYGSPTLPNGLHDTGGALNFPILALVSALGIYLLIISGSVVTGAGATGACSNWPLCQFQLLPGGGLPLIHMSHRLVTVIIGFIFVYTLHTAFREPFNTPHLRWLSIIAAVLFTAQVGVGAATVLMQFPAELRALHLSLATLIWGSVVALAVLSLIRPGTGRSGTSDA
jgi:heme A synthase